jgi:hypothetical protein
MQQPTVTAFFYGSYMNLDVLNEYIDRISKPARDYRFPAWYIHRLESFRAG